MAKKIGVNLMDASIALVVQAREETERSLKYYIGAWSVAHDAITRERVRKYIETMRIVERFIQTLCESGLGNVMRHFEM